MKYLIIIFVIFGVGLYLNRAYAHAYKMLGANNLANPTTHQIIAVPFSATAFTKKIVYVALGDSLTAGVGATAQDKTYPYRLAKLLTEKQNAQVKVVNLGSPGATAEDVLKIQVPMVAELHPDIITIAVGINDMHNQVSAELFQQTMATIIDKLASTSKHLNIINIPYLGNNSVFLPPYRAYFDWQTKRYNSLLNAASAGRQVNIIDLYSLTREKAFNDSSYYSTDGFHPSDNGFDFWSKVLYEHLDY